VIEAITVTNPGHPLYGRRELSDSRLLPEMCQDLTWIVAMVHVAAETRNLTSSIEQLKYAIETDI